MSRRLAAAFLGLVLTGSAFASKYAIVVAVDSYPFVTKPSQQLHGAETDASVMKRMLDLFGFQTDVMLQKQATRMAIIGALGKLDNQVQKGDEVVFYFSGRGSIAPDSYHPGSKTGYEPTLVPSDGAANSVDNDFRIGHLEDWASDLDRKGAHVTVILDTCFQNPVRSDFGRQYNPTPRCVQRAITADGDVRDALYGGPGIILSACPARGCAYEWLVNASEERWGGAFTDQLVNAVVAALYRGENPTFMDAMREVQAYFKDKVRADYMPGLDPYPSMPDQIGDPKRFSAPFLGGIDFSTLPADSKIAIAGLERMRQERERKLRVALEISDAADENERNKAYDKFSKDLADYLKSKVPNSEFAPAGAPPDVIVRLKAPAKGPVEASVVGDDLDKTKVYTFAGKTFRKALDDGLAPYLELRGLVTRMYRLTASEPPTWDAPLDFGSDAAAYSRGDGFTLNVSGPQNSLLFILDRDDADGILQLAFPQVGAPYKQKLSGPLQLSGQIQNDTNSGRMLMRAIVVPIKGRGVGEVSMADDKKFRDSLLKQLRTVVGAMEKKQLPWTVKTINLRIR